MSDTHISHPPILPDPIPIVPDAKTELSLTGPTSEQVIQRQTTNQDYVVLRYAVLGLVIAIAATILGVIFLGYQEKPVPDGVVAMGSAAVGALATMLVRPPLYPSNKP